MKTLSLLAGKQKRLLGWQEILEGSSLDPVLRQELFDTMKRYRNLLARVWKEGECSAELGVELGNLERELEKLDDYSRLKTFRPAA